MPESLAPIPRPRRRPKPCKPFGAYILIEDHDSVLLILCLLIVIFLGETALHKWLDVVGPQHGSLSTDREHQNTA